MNPGVNEGRIGYSLSKINLIGKRFGRLVVLQELEPIKKHRRWLCKCDCGKTASIFQTCLTSGNTRSCGCLVGETAKRVHTTHGENNKNSRLHSIWCGMLGRCRNTNNNRFSDYGGRGITVCEDWLDYSTFKEWVVNNGYSDTLTLDRINVNGNYEPNNCKWSTNIEQQNNMRSNVLIEYCGETLTLAQWSRRLNIRYGTLVNRRARGWSVERMLTTPTCR